jgi:hypothetical protein
LTKKSFNEIITKSLAYSSYYEFKTTTTANPTEPRTGS